MFGIGNIVKTLNKIDKCTALHEQKLGFVEEAFNKHVTEESKWQGGVYERLEEIGKCPEAENIEKLQEYDRKQNSKIDKVSANIALLLKIVVPIFIMIVGVAIKIIFFK